MWSDPVLWSGATLSLRPKLNTCRLCGGETICVKCQNLLLLCGWWRVRLLKEALHPRYLKADPRCRGDGGTRSRTRGRMVILVFSCLCKDLRQGQLLIDWTDAVMLWHQTISWSWVDFYLPSARWRLGTGMSSIGGHLRFSQSIWEQTSYGIQSAKPGFPTPPGPVTLNLPTLGHLHAKERQEQAQGRIWPARGCLLPPLRLHTSPFFRHCNSWKMNFVSILS